MAARPSVAPGEPPAALTGKSMGNSDGSAGVELAATTPGISSSRFDTALVYAPSRVGIPRRRHADRHRQQVIGAEPGIDAGEEPEAAHQQPGADEKHGRQR